MPGNAASARANLGPPVEQQADHQEGVHEPGNDGDAEDRQVRRHGAEHSREVLQPGRGRDKGKDRPQRGAEQRQAELPSNAEVEAFLRGGQRGHHAGLAASAGLAGRRPAARLPLRRRVSAGRGARRQTCRSPCAQAWQEVGAPVVTADAGTAVRWRDAAHGVFIGVVPTVCLLSASSEAPTVGPRTPRRRGAGSGESVTARASAPPEWRGLAVAPKHRLNRIDRWGRAAPTCP